MIKFFFKVFTAKDLAEEYEKVYASNALQEIVSLTSN